MNELSLVEELNHLRAELSAIKNLQVEVILQLHDELTAQKIENATLRGEIAQLKANRSLAPVNEHSNNGHSRSRKKANGGLPLGLRVSSLVNSRTNDEQSIPNNQFVTGSNPGGIIMSGAATWSGTPPADGSYGLVASSMTNLDLTNLPNAGVGVFGSANNFGVYGTSESGSGVRGSSENGSGVSGVSSNYFGVYAYSDKTSGVYGYSNLGTGVMGVSKNNYGLRGGSINYSGVWGDSSNGPGVSGTSTNGYGLEANSRNNAPLRIYPKDSAGPPTSGTHERGEIWLDSVGDLFVYNGNAWKKVKYV